MLTSRSANGRHGLRPHSTRDGTCCRAGASRYLTSRAGPSLILMPATTIAAAEAPAARQAAAATTAADTAAAAVPAGALVLVPICNIKHVSQPSKDVITGSCSCCRCCACIRSGSNHVLGGVPAVGPARLLIPAKQVSTAAAVAVICSKVCSKIVVQEVCNAVNHSLAVQALHSCMAHVTG